MGTGEDETFHMSSLMSFQRFGFLIQGFRNNFEHFFKCSAQNTSLIVSVPLPNSKTFHEEHTDAVFHKDPTFCHHLKFLTDALSFGNLQPLPVKA